MTTTTTPTTTCPSWCNTRHDLSLDPRHRPRARRHGSGHRRRGPRGWAETYTASNTTGVRTERVPLVACQDKLTPGRDPSPWGSRHLLGIRPISP
jgi:hypothetical protein